MPIRHKVFLSYHHAADEAWRREFERLFQRDADIFVNWSVDIGDIDPQANTEYVRQRIRDEYLRDSTVTLVLVGQETWQRKHVDWEIYSSLRDTRLNPRSGLLGVLLPSYRKPTRTTYDPHTLPPRLHDNVAGGFATVHDWTNSPSQIAEWIHDAFVRRVEAQPDNSRAMFARNRTGAQWSE